MFKQTSPKVKQVALYKVNDRRPALVLFSRLQTNSTRTDPSPSSPPRSCQNLQHTFCPADHPAGRSPAGSAGSCGPSPVWTSNRGSWRSGKSSQLSVKRALAALEKGFPSAPSERRQALESRKFLFSVPITHHEVKQEMAKPHFSNPPSFFPRCDKRACSSASGFLLRSTS